MVEYFNTHLYAFWYAAGFIMLAVELLVLGFSTGFVLFLGLAALATGGLLWFEVIPHSWLASIASFSISSAIISALLWKPFKRLEAGKNSPGRDNTSDFIGLKFRLDSAITRANSGTTRYSGVEWKVEIDETAEVNEIAAGALVRVVSLDAGKFRVAPAE